MIECMLDQGYVDALQASVADLLERGSGWRSRFDTAIKRLSARHAAIAARFVADVSSQAQ